MGVRIGVPYKSGAQKDDGRNHREVRNMARVHLVSIFCLAGLFPVVARATAPTPAEAASEVDSRLDRELLGDKAGQTAPLVGDEMFVRRVFLDLIGELPTAEDVIAFTLDTGSDKRVRLVETLLADEAFGENWGNYWRDVIMYRRSDQRAGVAYGALTQFLTEQFNQGASWDATVKALITAEGNIRENGATGLMAAHGGRPEETVAELSRIFLGIQIQCAQCHDHPTDRWKREQFHQLAAFFPRVAMRPDRDEALRTFVIEGRDRFPPRRRSNDNRFIGTAEHQMPDLEHPDQEGPAIQPVFFVTGQQLILGTTDQERRSQLADWLTSTSNPWFAAAVVNRVWAELVGEGFYEPVDDLGPDRHCSAPETMEYLNTSFAASGYDLRWLYRTITSTRAYQRQSRSRRGPDGTPYLANCSQRLRGDQLFAALSAVLGGPIGRIAPQGPRPGGGPRGQFNEAFGYDPSERRDEITGSIQEALFMMNSPLINSQLRARPGTELGRLLAAVGNDEQLIVELYLKALARQPSDQELKICLAHIQQTGDRDEAAEDILWSLLNSAEFLHRK